MDKKEKLEILWKLSEKELTKKFLIPLYESDGMGCKNVRYKHGNLEFGRDIIYYRDDHYGKRIYTGVQVKKVRVAMRNLNEVFRQTCEALGEPFTDWSDGRKKDLDRFVVLTPKGFTERASISFWACLRSVKLDRLVTCIEGNSLVELIDKHCRSLFHRSHRYPNECYVALEHFMEMLDRPKCGVQDLKRFFVKNPWLVAINDKYRHAIGEEGGGDYPDVDLSLETFEHDYDVMVLKPHTDPIITGAMSNWKLSKECEAGIAQLYRYFEWYDRALERLHYRPRIEVYESAGFLVIGRNILEQVQSRLKTINSQFRRISILTYDDLYLQAKRAIEQKMDQEK